MKKFIICLIMSIGLALSVGAQEFVAPSKGVKQFTDTTTTYTYKMPDKTYNVYKSKNGCYYIWRISKKTGKPYKSYLPKEIQKQMGRKYK